MRALSEAGFVTEADRRRPTIEIKTTGRSTYRDGIQELTIRQE